MDARVTGQTLSIVTTVRAEVVTGSADAGQQVPQAAAPASYDRAAEALARAARAIGADAVIAASYDYRRVAEVAGAVPPQQHYVLRATGTAVRVV